MDEAQVAKLKELGIDLPGLIREISDGIETGLASKMKLGIEDMEIKLGQKIEQGQKETGKEIGQSISALVETAVTAKLPELVNKVGGEFVAKLKAGNGEQAEALAGGKGGGLGGMLDRATPQDILEIIKVWKEPSTTEALKGQMGLLIQGMNLGLRLKASPDVISEMAKTVDQSFGAAT